MSAVQFACPKSMVFGPCGGVRSDGRCEVAEHPCVFLDRPLPTWPAAATRPAAAAEPGAGAEPGAARIPSAERMLARLAEAASGGAPVIVSDLPTVALDAESLAATSRIVAGHADAVLLGDSPAHRVQLPPTLRAQIVQSNGLAAWTGLNARDRNRVALEAELAGLAIVGVAGVHAVTGDHTDSGARPDAKPVFDLDSMRIAAAARAAGHLVSVAEAPASPPMAERPHRLIEKLRAGADLCFVDHCGGVDAVARFSRRVGEFADASGVASPPLIACVPAVIDRGSAELLASFPALVLPDGYLDALLTASDVRAAGIAATTELARRMLEIPGVVGVNLSGGAGDGAEVAFADALAELGDRIRV